MLRRCSNCVIVLFMNITPTRLSNIWIVLLALHGQMLIAQVTRTSLGNDFWVVFPPTEHTTSSGQLVVFIAAQHNTVVNIEATDRNGMSTTQSLPVGAGTISEITFDRALFELRSAEYPVGSLNDCERISTSHVHITTDSAVAVYAAVNDQYTSDAWMVLPTTSLGNSYRVLSYASDYTTSRIGFIIQELFYPSQFVIVATEDSTVVDITLSVSRSRSGIWKERQITLNKGECYLVQAHVSSTSPNEDLTASVVQASKPIGVLGSHLRAQIPITANGASRDFLVEQLQSTDVWGTKYVVPPLHVPNDYIQSGQNDVSVVRVLTNEDSTFVSLDGLPPLLLVRAGNVWEMPLQRGRVIQSSKPVLVGVFDRSSRRDAGTIRSGDPSFIIIPPAEQYLDTYRIVSIDPKRSNNSVYDEHFLTIVAPISRQTYSVDGVGLPPLTPIAGSDYGYVHQRVAAGTHIVHAEPDPSLDTITSFGVVVYGYGPAESYGYTGGMSFTKLYGPSVWLRVLNVNAAPADSTAFIIVVDSISNKASFDALQVNAARIEVTYNPTIYVPSLRDFNNMIPVDQGRWQITASSSFSELKDGDTVATIRGVTVLGNVVADSVEIRSVHWFRDMVNEERISTHTVKGWHTIMNVCENNGTRLFNPYSNSAPLKRWFNILGQEVVKPENETMIIEVETDGSQSVMRWFHP